jgi:hypothetical protein
VSRGILVALLLAGGAVGCLRERDRLDVPRVTLVLADSIVAPGDSVRGYAYALDATGIIFLQVTATTNDSSFSKRLNRVSADSVRIDFALRVPGNAEGDVPVSVRALARDAQDFEVSVTDTVFVRIGGAIR